MKKLPDALIRWTLRLAVAAAVLSVFGYYSTPKVEPLMCKIYG